MATEEVLRNHPSHRRHVLELKNYMEPYTCNGCKEKGFGPRYRCEKCDFDLHKPCTYDWIAPVSHEFFPNSRFRFMRIPPKPCHRKCKIRCNACRKTIKGFVFHCEENNSDIHPCCRELKRSYQIEDVKFNLQWKMEGECMWCKSERLEDGGEDNGWSYVSECGEYHVHVACVTKMALDEWYKNQSGGGGSTRSTTSGTQSVAVRLNPREIQARRQVERGGIEKFWRVMKFIVKTVISIVIGDPTTILASFLVDLLT
ncbi:uncharacterized protein LOC111809312 [Cucurbita pepo subsp. pepo]|uniref:uncharacterized protein LOC111809312 n=1 Tax=Cucurbita pepo subsp. pepo TaxID=3664 RepID=UPI000C9D442E|nr:uncharacterized protein LOC111809312 [Cucurbita pepo subsp. pepo]